MQKPETKFRAKVDKRLSELKNAWFESIQQRSIQGTPDKLGCVNGTFVALELKAEKGKPSPLQELKLRRIGQAGGFAMVLYPDNLDSTMALLHFLDTLEKGHDVKTILGAIERAQLCKRDSESLEGE